MSQTPIRRLDAREPEFLSTLDALLAFEAEADGRIDAAVTEILQAVRTTGDAAVLLRITGGLSSTTDIAAIDLAPINPAPAGRERLELAIAYLDLGDLETARSLLQEVAAGQDPVARDEALLLLREIG